MNRTMSMALLGAALLIPMEADAQRARNRGPAVQRPVEAPRSGRLVDCGDRRRGNQPFVCADDRRSRVVYRSGSRIANRVWVSARLGRAPIYMPRRRIRHGELNQGRLNDLLGRRLVRDVRDHGRRFGLRGQVRGHFAPRNRWDDVLVLTMRGQEVARVIDYDRDGLADELLLRNFRRRYAAW